MTTEQLQDGLKALLEEALAVAIGEIDEGEMTMPDELQELIRVENFADAGILTHDAGFVLRFKGDREFQVTLVRSR